jgi:hypothetical protein
LSSSARQFSDVRLGPHASRPDLRIERMAQRRLPLVLLSSIAEIAVGPPPVRAGEPKPIGAPLHAIEQAIDAAKRCALARNVRLVGSFIESALRAQPSWRPRPCSASDLTARLCER